MAALAVLFFYTDWLSPCTKWFSPTRPALSWAVEWQSGWTSPVISPTESCKRVIRYRKQYPELFGRWEIRLTFWSMLRSSLSDPESMVLESGRMAQGHGLHRRLGLGCHPPLFRRLRFRIRLGDWTSFRPLPFRPRWSSRLHLTSSLITGTTHNYLMIFIFPRNPLMNIPWTGCN